MPSTNALPLRDDLQGTAPYGAPMLDVPVILNVNENPYPPSPRVVASIAGAVAEAAAGANRYPDRDFAGLRQDLASYLEHESHVSVPPEQLWAGNGSNEVMLHLHQAFAGPGRTVLSFEPTYSMYPEYSRTTASQYLGTPRRADFTLDIAQATELIAQTRPCLVLLASPNNPTGTAMPLCDVESLLLAAQGSGPEVGGRASDALVVVDEAYGEFRRAKTPSALTLLERYGNLVVTRTMSKAFGMAGLRLGYLAASRQVVDALRVVRLPYHLSAFTQAAARAALAHGDELMAQVAQLRGERDSFVAWLGERGFESIDSDANFVLVGPLEQRHQVWEALVERGILVREVGPEGYLRVTIGTPSEMAQLKEELLAVTGRAGAGFGI